MHESKRQIGEALSPLLKQHGYQKSALTWHKRGAEVISVFHVEKNRWGADHYSFHLGAYLRALGSEESPPHYRCPVQLTLDQLMPDPDVLERASDFEDTSLGVSDRLSQIVALVSDYALPWLKRYSSMHELKLLMRTDYASLLPRVLVFRETYDYLRSVDQSA